LNRLSRLQNSNLGSSIFQEFTVPFLKIQSRQFIMTEIHCLNAKFENGTVIRDTLPPTRAPSLPARYSPTKSECPSSKVAYSR
jgi:hypothetical protein